MRPEQEPILMDMIHAAAFRENTLGLPKLCPAENLDVITRNVLLNYLKYHHTPDRMVVAGVGVSNRVKKKLQDLLITLLFLGGTR